MTEYFQDKGIQAVSLHSGTLGITRGEAIRSLTRGDLKVIFIVDLFNEVVDIPNVDTLLFVRPTEPLTVFTQQVGRGLRLSEQKFHCVIIYLIGNYRNADVKLRLFANEGKAEGKVREAVIPIVPIGYQLHLETAAINLLDELSSKRLPHRERLHRSFLDLKNEISKIPTYLNLHLYGESNSWEYRREFGSYVGFLLWAQCLT